MIYVWALGTAVCAVIAEIALNRALSYWPVLLFTAPLAIAVNYGVFHLLRFGPSLISSLAVFSIATLLVRVTYSVGVHQPVGYGTWAAVGLIVVAGVLRHIWP